MKTIITTLVVFLSLVSYGQKKNEKSSTNANRNVTKSKTAADTVRPQVGYQAGVHLLSKFYGDSIVLRWAPTTPGGWTNGNAGGYIVSRTTIEPDGNFDPSTFKTLNTVPIKPWPLDKWSSIAGQKSTNNYAKIAAQALYGQSFSPATGFVDKADEYVSRYSFVLLAADLSPITADALGLRFTDKNVEKNKLYVYRISSLVDSTKYKLTPGFVTVNTDKIEVLDKATISDTKEKQNLIEIYWDRRIHSSVFSAYWIERSEDGGATFRRLNNVPFVNPIDQKNPRSIDYIIYGDSIPVNYKTYKYRIIGISPFGESSPPSDQVTVMGRDKTPPPVPLNLKSVALTKSKVKLTWDYPKDVKDLKGFIIGRGDNPSQTFTPLVTELLPPKTREFIDESPSDDLSNFYIVAAVDTAGNANLSLAKYALIVDSIPPLPPTGLKAKIDTNGIVKLSWKVGKEKDIQGYQVYFSNQKDHEFSQLTHGPLVDSLYTDTITLKTLSKKIFYRVVAVDLNYNYSKFSDILEVKKPDVVPPSAAVFDTYKVTNEGISLNWVTSSSTDLARTILYRQSEDGAWVEVANFSAKDKVASYIDTKVESGKFYSYSLISEDEDKLRSKRSHPIKLRYVNLKAKAVVSKLVATPDLNKVTIRLNWEYVACKGCRFVIYRAVNGGNFISYRSVEGQMKSFEDKEVRRGSTFEYTIKVLFEDGSSTGFGTIVKSEIK